MSGVDADFLVIGGGIAGTSAGAALAAHGRVTLVEAEAALGYHASGRSAALYEAAYGAAATRALSEASRDGHEAAGVLSPRGLMLLGRAETDALFEADLTGMGIAEIPVEDACAKVPILDARVVTRAALDPHAWDIDTDRLIQHYARAIRANGSIETGAGVVQIARDGRGWSVDLSNGRTLRACCLINAAGAWADRIAGMAGVVPLGLKPLRRSMARLPAPGGHDVSAWPMLLGAGELWYAKPDAGKLLVSPADEDPVEPHDAWAEDMVLAEGLARYEAHVTEPVTRVETSWAGLRTFAPDRALVLGPDPDAPGFVWCAGQGGYGFQTAPAAAALLAALVTGEMPALPMQVVTALRPDRFR